MKTYRAHAVHGFTAIVVVLALAGCEAPRPAADSAAPEARPAASAAATTPAPTPAPVATIAPPPAPPRIEATEAAVAKAKADLQKNADRARRMRAALSFEDFKATVYKEPFPGGKYIVNGDTPIASEKQLREFYDRKVKPMVMVSLVVNQAGGLDTKWNQQQQKALTYCVSKSFGARHAVIVTAMAAATAAWEEPAAVKYVYTAAQDTNCGPTNGNVVFDVNPVNVGGEYLARAFFPDEPRAARNVLIDQTSFELEPTGKLQLVGILRHELGHTLGFRHEHTRPESGRCFEDPDWAPLTSYDAFSVMHYPQCNGRGDWSLTLTTLDKNGVACAYGPAAGFTIDTTLVEAAKCVAVPPDAPPAGEAKTETFNAQSLAQGAQKAFGPFTVTPLSTFEATLHGVDPAGDPDLYVRFGSAPTLGLYDCRPYTDGAEETCALTVPAGASKVFVMVHGFTKAGYDLQVEYVAPAPAHP